MQRKFTFGRYEPNSFRDILFKIKHAAVMLVLFLIGFGARVEAVQAVGVLDPKELPERGAVMTEPPPVLRDGEPDWQWAMVSGNGTMGALVNGIPGDDAIVLSHENFIWTGSSRSCSPTCAPM